MENRYEGNIAAHINLICKGCSRIMDYKLPISINPKEVAKKAHFWVDRYQIRILRVLSGVQEEMTFSH